LFGTGKVAFSPVVVGSGRICVQLELGYQGRDLILLVTGGEAHVGAVAVWDRRQTAGTASVTELPGHKEGPLAGACAKIVGRATGCRVVAVVGIHQDEATGEEIDAIVANAELAAHEAAEIFLQRNASSNAE
jgi:hypothetical protein